MWQAEQQAPHRSGLSRNASGARQVPRQHVSPSAQTLPRSPQFDADGATCPLFFGARADAVDAFPGAITTRSAVIAPLAREGAQVAAAATLHLQAVAGRADAVIVDADGARLQAAVPVALAGFAMSTTDEGRDLDADLLPAGETGAAIPIDRALETVAMAGARLVDAETGVVNQSAGAGTYPLEASELLAAGVGKHASGIGRDTAQVRGVAIPFGIEQPARATANALETDVSGAAAVQFTAGHAGRETGCPVG
jgi:hypothetical protein